jgi:hypothetical protein
MDIMLRSRLLWLGGKSDSQPTIQQLSSLSATFQELITLWSLHLFLDEEVTKNPNCTADTASNLRGQAMSSAASRKLH